MTKKSLQSSLNNAGAPMALRDPTDGARSNAISARNDILNMCSPPPTARTTDEPTDAK